MSQETRPVARKWTDEEVRAAVSHFRNLTLEERKGRQYRAEWYDYTFARWRCNGKVQTWVTQPGRVSIPAKHGMSTYGYFDQNDVMLVGPEPLAQGLRKQLLSGHRRRVLDAVASLVRRTTVAAS